MKIFNLSSGIFITHISAHEFQCSDGSVIGPQDQVVVDTFTLKRTFRKVKEISGMAVNEVRMLLDSNQISKLKEISAEVDLVVVPFPILVALREQEIREEFPNVVAFNATQETQRSAPQDKIVDINNWSW